MLAKVVLWFVSLALITGPSWADLRFQGVATPGAVLIGQVPPGTTVVRDGRSLRVSRAGDFLLGIGRDEQGPVKLRLTYPDGKEIRRTVEVKDRKYDIQRVDGLPQRKVTPKPQDLKRIQADSALIGKARQRDDARTDFLSGWEWPVLGRISGVYGSQRILNGTPKRPHFGVDVAVPEGTPVVAPADGIVTMLHPDMFYSGVTLMLDHGHGLSTVYLHLKESLVEEGDRVTRGMAIARVGQSGRATGPHLHWGMNLFKERLDPALLVGAMPAQ